MSTTFLRVSSSSYVFSPYLPLQMFPSFNLTTANNADQDGSTAMKIRSIVSHFEWACFSFGSSNSFCGGLQHQVSHSHSKHQCLPSQTSHFRKVLLELFLLIILPHKHARTANTNLSTIKFGVFLVFFISIDSLHLTILISTLRQGAPTLN